MDFIIVLPFFPPLKVLCWAKRLHIQRYWFFPFIPTTVFASRMQNSESTVFSGKALNSWLVLHMAYWLAPVLCRGSHGSVLCGHCSSATRVNREEGELMTEELAEKAIYGCFMRVTQGNIRSCQKNTFLLEQNRVFPHIWCNAKMNSSIQLNILRHV